MKVALSSLWQYRARNFFSITIICLSFLIVGVFFSLSNNLQHIARQLSENMVVAFFIDPAATEPEVREVENRIRASASVVRLNLVSREEALEQVPEELPRARGGPVEPERQPLPRFGRGDPQERTPSCRRRRSPGSPRSRACPGSRTSSSIGTGWRRCESLSRLARAVGFFLGGILILASFFIISNVIRLNVFSRKGEIEILRLVGATNTFIRIPFLVEGIALGILGSGLSLALLYLLVKLFPLYLGQSLGALREMIAFRYLSLPQSLSLVAGSAVMGLLGSLSSLARFLKI